MANVQAIKPGVVKITLNDGVERELKYTLNALAELEDAYGSVDAAFDKLEKTGSVKALRKVLWAGLIHADCTLTEQTVGNLIDLSYMSQLMQSVGEAMESQMPSQDTVTEGKTLPNV